MKHLAAIILATALLTCSQTEKPSALVTYIGSTPGDSIMKPMLGLPDATQIDFIRWTLQLGDDKNFKLDLHYGIGKPSTPDFMEGGEKRLLKGKYEIIKNQAVNNNNVIRLNIEGLKQPLSFVKLNENIIHILTYDYRLMVGNGGWSYTLMLEKPTKVKSELPVLKKSLAFDKDTSTEWSFVGRTPSEEFVAEYNISVPHAWNKLKWGLKLYRDPVTHQPTIYRLGRTDDRSKLFTGKWIIVNGKNGIIMIQLDPDKPDQRLSFLVGDENVLFMLDKSNNLFVGNRDFSYTLNRGHFTLKNP